MTTEKKTPTKVHVTVNMSPVEAAHLMQLRARTELSQLRRISTSQVLRDAIRQAYEAKLTLDVARPEEARRERFDLILDDELRAVVVEIQGEYEGATLNDIVVAAAMIAKDQVKQTRAKRVPRS